MKTKLLFTSLALSVVAMTGIKAQNCNASATVTNSSTPGLVNINDMSMSSGGAGAAGTISYISFSDGGFVNLQPATTTGTYQFTTDGTYTYYVEVMDSITNCYDSIGGTITITGTTGSLNCNASFALQPDSSNVGQYYAWNNSTGGSLSYYWDFDDGSSSTLAYPTHTYTATGTYVICLTVTSPSCTSTYCDTLVATVKASGTTLNVLAPGQVVGIENPEFVSNLNTYPNPFGSFVNVSVSSTQFQELQLSVISIDGSQVYSENVSVEAGENLIELNELQMSSGIYMLNVTNPLTGQSKMHKMIKK